MFAMYIFSSTVFQALKVFLTGIAASLIPAALMLGRASLSENKAAAFVLITASLFIFLFLHRLTMTRLFDESFSAADFWIPALVSYALYALTAALLYAFRLSGIYNWLFMPTRFLEPVVSKPYVSFIAAHALALCTTLSVPAAR